VGQTKQIMRKIIIGIFGILLILGALFIAKKVGDAKSVERPKPKQVEKQVSVQRVKNTFVPVQITTSGNLIAKNKVDLSSEVQGILKQGRKDFKPGTYYAKGETILSINNDEHMANLRASKSSFYSALTAIMPDLQLDYPNVYPKWQQYLQSVDMNKNLPKLPEMQSEKEKYFITGHNILSSYYNVKNAEVRLAKYAIRAPFSGVLSETTVNPGALINMGQKLGTFVSTSVYELQLNINTEFIDLLQKGKTVTLHNIDHSKSWQGVISRINPTVDQTTQTIPLYIDLKGKNLKEGMYLEAVLNTRPIENAISVKRSLLVENSFMFTIKDSLLLKTPVRVAYTNKDDVVIVGLQDGTTYIDNPLPGAHEGMVVKIMNQ